MASDAGDTLNAHPGRAPRHRGDNPELDGWADLRGRPGEDGEFDVDPWAWLDREDAEEADVDLSGCVVTAVLVALDAEAWLPDTLAGLASLRHRPDRVIAIDNDSTDASATLLRRALQQGVLDAVYRGRRTYGFGAAVAAALHQDLEDAGHDPLRPSLLRPRHASGTATAWLWLLHDDAVPAPDALDKLLAHVTLEPSIDVTGPKLLLPKRRGGSGPRSGAQRISEVGVSISGTGRREVLLDAGEIDQGQRDAAHERLGVSTCGMLVRAHVWESLGGFDPALPVFRDGVEFGWRTHLAGHRVVTTPRAQMTHRQVGRAGLRPHGAAGRRPGKVDRELGMLVVVGHARTAQLPLIWLRLVWGSVMHAIGYLLGKVPGRSLDEILALGTFLGQPSRITAYRRRVKISSPVAGAHEVVRRLRPPWWSSLRVAGEAVSGAISDRYRSVAGDLEVASLDELTGDDFASIGEEKPTSPWLSPIVITLVGTVIASLVAARSLLHSGSLVAPALLPAPSFSALWHAAWSPIAGAPGQSSPPWLALAALGSTLFAGRPEWFVTVLLCLIVPLALLAVYPVVRRVATDRRLRLWVALSYALLPVLLGGTNQGRLSLSVVAIALPQLGLAAQAIALRRPGAPEGWRGGWGAGVVLVALVAFEPSMIIFAALLGVAGIVHLRRSFRKFGRIGIALGVPLVVLAPWWLSIVNDWGRLLTGPDPALGGTPAAPAVWQLLVGREVGPGLPPLWLGALIFGVFWIAALAGLARLPAQRVVLTGWTTALIGFAMAVVLSRLVVTVPPQGVETRPWAGAYLLVGFAGLLLAAAAGLDGVAGQVRAVSFSWLQPATVLASALVGVLTLAGVAWWVIAGAGGPIERQRLEAIPPYIRIAMQSDAGLRVLAIELRKGKAHFAVVDDNQIRLGDADRGFAFGGATQAQSEAKDLAVRLVAGTADADIVPQLRELGIGFVWVHGATEDDQAKIDNTPGLGTASGNSSSTIWQVEGADSRIRLLSPDGQVGVVARPPTVLPPGPAGRQLQLGEPADPRWRATLDGHPLAAVPAGWQQAFAVPAGGGRLSYELRSPIRWWLLVQALLLAVASVLAAPAVRRPEVRDPTKSARRAATLAGAPR